MSIDRRLVRRLFGRYEESNPITIGHGMDTRLLRRLAGVRGTASSHVNRIRETIQRRIGILK